MNPALYNTTVPLALFFIAFFIVFTLMELIIIWILNRLETYGWEFFVDVIMRAAVHHGKMIRIFATLLLIVVAASLLIFTPVISVVRGFSFEMKAFAVLLIITMMLVYKITVKKVTTLAIEQKIHCYLYQMVSLILYVLILNFANESYTLYKSFINNGITDPALKNAVQVIDQKKTEALLDVFRDQIAKGECPQTDLRKTSGSLSQLIYVAADPSLAVKAGEANPKDTGTFMVGRLCTHDEKSMILTDYGTWFYVESL